MTWLASLIGVLAWTLAGVMTAIAAGWIRRS